MVFSFAGMDSTHGVKTWMRQRVTWRFSNSCWKRLAAGAHSERLFKTEDDMAVVRIPAEGRTLNDKSAVAEHLSSIGIDYETWTPSHPLSANASSEEILVAYSAEIEQLKTRGGYVTADVISVNPQTPNLDAMLAKFSREHWHD